MTTATEAKELWCPMVRIARQEDPIKYADAYDRRPIYGQRPVAVVGGCNADALGSTRVPDSCRCIAGQCAMWRWIDTEPERPEPLAWWPLDPNEPHEEPPRAPDVPATAVWIPLTGQGDDLQGGFWETNPEELRAQHAEMMAIRRGYCGLAGRPEVMP